MEDPAATRNRPQPSSGRSVGGESTGDQTRSTYMSEADQSVRRKQIKEIMKDKSMNQQEKNKLIQGLMDGRRRSSIGTATSAASRRGSVGSNLSRSVHSSNNSSQDGAAPRQQQPYAAATSHNGFYTSDGEGDTVMSEAPEDIYDYNQQDNRSVASSISHTSYGNEDYYSQDRDGGGRNNNGNAQPPNAPFPAGMYRQMHGRSFSLQDWNEESRATAAANVNTLFTEHAAKHPNADPLAISRLMEQGRPPCQHYERNCTIISACCGLAFGCRICHDECPVLPPPIHVRERHGLMVGDQVMQAAAHHHHHSGRPGGAGGGVMERRRSMPLENETFDDDEEQHHLIDRFAIREVICRQCFTRQSSKTNNCKNCNVQFGSYHCNICNLWMSDAESPYHCTECGFCRVGGRENFRHCRDCGMCIDTLLFDDHNCKAGKYNSNCPVCQEDLFSSRQASHEMPCGHAIHWHCFKELTSFDTRCPVCKKTAETPEQMASTWSALAMGIALQPVPPDLARVVNVYCNDCEERDYERRWHFLGVRCMHCLSFNTNVEQIVLQGQEAATYLDAQEAARGEETGGVPPTISALALQAGGDNNGDDDDDDDIDDAMDEDVPPGGLDTSSGTESDNMGRNDSFDD